MMPGGGRSPRRGWDAASLKGCTGRGGVMRWQACLLLPAGWLAGWLAGCWPLSTPTCHAVRRRCREEVASCSERAYNSLSVADAAAMMMLGSEAEVVEFAAEVC